MKVVRAVVGTLVLVAVAAVTVLAVGMRTKSPTVLGAVRRMNRAVFNPRQHDAGEPGAYASLIRHAGRTSGAAYETPIVAVDTGDGFVIALPYGTRADWVQNVLAAGSATLVHEGGTHLVDRPEVVPIATADAHFAPGDRRAHRLFGVDECLRVRRVDDEPAVTPV